MVPGAIGDRRFRLWKRGDETAVGASCGGEPRGLASRGNVIARKDSANARPIYVVAIHNRNGVRDVIHRFRSVP